MDSTAKVRKGKFFEILPKYQSQQRNFFGGFPSRSAISIFTAELMQSLSFSLSIQKFETTQQALQKRGAQAHHYGQPAAAQLPAL